MRSPWARGAALRRWAVALQVGVGVVGLGLGGRARTRRETRAGPSDDILAEAADPLGLADLYSDDDEPEATDDQRAGR